MSWTKKVVVNYYFINTDEESYFRDLENTLKKMHTDDNAFEFEADNIHYFSKINSIVDITDTSTYFVSLVKSKNDWLVWYNQNEISEIPLTDGELGEIYYALINPEKRFILSTVSAGAFQKYLNEFSKTGSVKLVPLFEDKIDIKTLSWDFYKKIAVTVNFPSYGHRAEFMTTKEGSLMGIIDELNGLKANITISAPKANSQLNKSQLREVVKDLLVNPFCSKLVIRGAEFGEEIQEFDLKNAQVKYKEIIEIVGSYMTEDEALPTLKRAFNDRSYDLANGY